MKFKEGNTLGGAKPGISNKAKEKVLEAWLKQFQQEGTTAKIKELWDKDFKEFMRLFLQLLPKEQKFEGSANIFVHFSDEELDEYIENARKSSIDGA